MVTKNRPVPALVLNYALVEIFPIVAGGALSIASALAAGCLIARRTPLPWAVRFVLGAAACSLGVFALLACAAGYLAVYILAGAVLMARAWRCPPAVTAPLPPLPWFFRAILAAWGALYLIYALAPEIQPDAIGYHLRLVSEGVRLHAFSGRIGFYDVLPQGLEMLFVPAFAIGAHSAAKLVHFAFLVATVPLLRQIARELEIGNVAGCTAAALFFLAPVCGVDGTSAYTDAGLVCACCAVLYLLIRWSRDPSPALVACAALSSAFCYAIKPPFACVAVVAMVFIAWRPRRIRGAVNDAPVLSRDCEGAVTKAPGNPVGSPPPLFLRTAAFTALTTLFILPWLLRAWLISGNPLAPFLNAWFPNPVATPDTERALAAVYSAFQPTFSWKQAPLDYTLRGGHQGILGPAFLLLPLAFPALRRTSGRWLTAASCVLAIPFLANTGTRFLMPALAPASLALASVLPTPASLALVAVEAVASLPAAMNLYTRPGEWRLRGAPPLAAALRLESEPDYLDRAIPGFGITRVIEAKTKEDAKIFSLTPVPDAYIAREILFDWHSVRAARFTDALQFAVRSRGTSARLLSWRWPDARYCGVRLTALAEMRLIETHLPRTPSGAASWTLRRAGQTYIEEDEKGLAGADFLIWPAEGTVARTDAHLPSGTWTPIDSTSERAVSRIDLRRDATAYLRRSGYRYILVSAAPGPFEDVASDMLRGPDAWGLRVAGQYDEAWLFYIPLVFVP